MADGSRGRSRQTSRGGGRFRRFAAGRWHGDWRTRSIDGRIRLLRVLVVVFLVLMGGRAAALAASGDLGELAARQQTKTIDLPARRGAILDRNGEKLAVGIPQMTVFASPRLLDDPLAAAGDLCGALRIKGKKQQRELAMALSDRENWFTFVARKTDPTFAEAAVALGLPGVGAYEEEERTYPMRGTAAQVIGFAGVDNSGLDGIESQYDEQLSGKPGSQVVIRDPGGRTLKTVEQTSPSPGKDVRLTLDAQIQYTAEHVLSTTVSAFRAKSAVGVVMDPRNGEILAMVNVPVVKNHDFSRDPKRNGNRAVTTPYEPGSIFKMVTVAGALADGTVKPTTRFTLSSTVQVADREISEAHKRGTVRYSVAEILRWSSNVGAVKIGQKMGEEDLYKWVEEFGFGAPTGIELPGESAGIVHHVKDWSGSSIGNIPLGQGISATPLQMAAAVSAIANGGVAVAPTVVKQVGDRVYPVEEGRRVIPTRVARQMRNMLAVAVAKGTGTNGRIQGYKVAGKTGTSQKVVDGTYSRSSHIASFAAMAPADDPQLVVLVAVDEPRGSSYFGGDVAAPAVREIMSFALQQLEIAP
jgi:cell division protein FtsI/penicillin-binding protein 2